jgi:toxin ParE1/3/4
MTEPVGIVWSHQALDDVLGIQAFIARTSPRYAELTATRFLTCVERLAGFPESGRVVPELGEPTVREIVCGAYRIMYEVRGPERVEILTVFRGSRAFPRAELPSIAVATSRLTFAAADGRFAEARCARVDRIRPQLSWGVMAQQRS